MNDENAVIMVIDPNGSSIDVIENPKATNPKFYSLTAVSS
jgi:hypothetical protein